MILGIAPDEILQLLCQASQDLAREGVVPTPLTADSIGPATTLRDLGLDSIAGLSLYMSLEGRLGQTLPMARLGLGGPLVEVARRVSEVLAEPPAQAAHPVVRLLAGAERDRAFALRYQIYVQEMARPQQYADHERRLIREPMDETGSVFGAFLGEELVGTLRLNQADDPSTQLYHELYSLDRFEAFDPGGLFLATKLMVRPDARHTETFLALTLGALELAYDQGARFGFMDCNAHLEETMRRIGWRPYRERVRHPEYGEVLPMCFVLHDAEHLAGCHPLIHSLATRRAQPTEPSVLFYNKFAGGNWYA